MGSGWVRWGIAMVSSIWVTSMVVTGISVGQAISSIAPSSVSTISVVEISWISFSFGITFSNNVGHSSGFDSRVAKSAWNGLSKHVGAWDTS